jgi:UDP-N-acetylmuramate-alanine ligase
VIVTDVYAARETQPDGGFSSRQVVEAMSHPDVRCMTDFSQIATFLVERMRPGDVLIVLSAGDADHITTMVEALLKERSENHD